MTASGTSGHKHGIWSGIQIPNCSTLALAVFDSNNSRARWLKYQVGTWPWRKILCVSCSHLPWSSWYQQYFRRWVYGYDLSQKEIVIKWIHYDYEFRPCQAQRSAITFWMVLRPRHQPNNPIVFRFEQEKTRKRYYLQCEGKATPPNTRNKTAKNSRLPPRLILFLCTKKRYNLRCGFGLVYVMTIASSGVHIYRVHNLYLQVNAKRNGG